MSLYITGDTHNDIDIGKIDSFNANIGSLLNRTDFLCVLGDFGAIWFGDERDDELLDKWENYPWTTLWIDGNHENFNAIAEYPVSHCFGGRVQFIRPHVIHLMRGEVYTICGKTIFTFGGAKSIDKAYRQRGVSWWPQEEPSDEEYDNGLNNLERVNWKVDYIFSHTGDTHSNQLLYSYHSYPESVSRYFDTVKEQLEYTHHYFGHHHTDEDIDEKNSCVYDKIIKLV